MRRTEITLLALDRNTELCVGSSSLSTGPVVADVTPADLVDQPIPGWDAAWIDLGGEG